MEAETPFQKVETFHKTFDPRRPEIPTAFTENEAHTRAAFKIEELVEFVAATSPNKEQLHEAVMLLHEALDKAEEKILGAFGEGREIGCLRFDRRKRRIRCGRYGNDGCR